MFASTSQDGLHRGLTNHHVFEAEQAVSFARIDNSSHIVNSVSSPVFGTKRRVAR